MTEDVIMEMVRAEYEIKRDMFPHLNLAPWDMLSEDDKQKLRKMLDIDTIDVRLDEPVSTFEPPKD